MDAAKCKTRTTLRIIQYHSHRVDNEEMVMLKVVVENDSRSFPVNVEDSLVCRKWRISDNSTGSFDVE